MKCKNCGHPLTKEGGHTLDQMFKFNCPNPEADIIEDRKGLLKEMNKIARGLR